VINNYKNYFAEIINIKVTCYRQNNWKCPTSYLYVVFFNSTHNGVSCAFLLDIR